MVMGAQHYQPVSAIRISRDVIMQRQLMVNAHVTYFRPKSVSIIPNFIVHPRRDKR